MVNDCNVAVVENDVVAVPPHHRCDRRIHRIDPGFSPRLRPLRRPRISTPLLGQMSHSQLSGHLNPHTGLGVSRKAREARLRRCSLSHSNSVR